jgi:hypothetical protein
MTKKTITYIGRRGNPTLRHFYTNGINTFSYKRVLIPAAKIGALIEITETEGSMVKVSGEDAPRIIGYFDDKVAVAQWEALSHSDVVLATKRRREKELNRDHSTPVDRAVSTLRTSMIGMNLTQRAAFTAYLIEQLH